jgi:hypothetical protein
MAWTLQEERQRTTRLPPQKRERNHPKAFTKKADFMSFLVPPAAPEETQFRHSSWSVKREKVKAALMRAGTGTFAMNRFEECGSQCTVEWSASLQKHRCRANYCKCKHCEPCMRSKANRIANNLRKKLEDNPDGRYRFITLTLKHNDAPLIEQVHRLYAAFKKLRTQKLWKQSQRGGAYTLEVKWNDKTRHWHPHLHIVSEGDFLRQQQLSDAWFAATGDSPVVDIRLLNNGRDAAHYVSKYVTKGTSSTVWTDPEVATEWIVATKGLRICATFGSWRGFKLTAVTDDADDWEPVASLLSLVQRARAGEQHATNLLILLRPPGGPDDRGHRRDGS